jgi:hypothetical protein
MNCVHCNKPIELVPSAAERARKWGGKASDYTNIFIEHTECLMRKNSEEVSELMREIRDEHTRNKISYPVRVG